MSGSTVSRETYFYKHRGAKYMDKLFGISIEWITLIGINFLLILILFLINLSNKLKIKKLNQKYFRLMNGVDGTNLEGVIVDCIEKVNGIVKKNKEIEYKINSIERNMYYCIQKVGVVRYNGFDNVGSNLSFSIALLDNNDDGVIISSLYARDSSSAYAKPISGSKSKYALSAEEIQAINIAKKESVASKYNSDSK